MPDFVYRYKGNIYINLTNRCVNRCTFCDVSVLSKDTGAQLKLDREPRISEVISDLKARLKTECGEIVFCGVGEPLLRLDDVIQITRWMVHNTEIPVRVNTAGTVQRLYPGRDVASELRRAGVKRISISLNAVTPDDYDNLCRPKYDDAYEDLLRFVHRCKEKGLETTVSFITDLADEEQAEALALALGVKAIFRSLRK